MKYIISKSGYYYKINGDKKVRISKEEYNKKRKLSTKTGGQHNKIHPSNLSNIPSKTIGKCATHKCNSCSNLNLRVQCIQNCIKKMR